MAKVKNNEHGTFAAQTSDIATCNGVLNGNAQRQHTGTTWRNDKTIRVTLKQLIKSCIA